MNRSPFSFFSLIILFLLVIACSKPTTSEPVTPPPPPPVVPELKASANAITLSGETTGIDSFTIQSNVAWKIEIEAATIVNWLHLSDVSGTGNKTIILKVIDRNTSGSPRAASIKIITTSNTSIQTATISVIQKVSGIPLWLKTYGYNSSDFGTDVCLAPDGNLVLAGTTASNDADPVNGHRGNGDIWVSKMTVDATPLWTKTFGGSAEEETNGIIPTADGGYAVVGSTWSNNGDIVGYKEGTDAYVLKLDANGNKVWIKIFGGSNADRGNAIAQTSDGGYLLVGHTDSRNGDIGVNYGYNDVFIIKMDGQGNRQWTKVLNGAIDETASSVIVNPDGSFMVTGSTLSNAGDFTGNHATMTQDAWVGKFDASGNTIWLKLYGGSQDEATRKIIRIADGSYVIAGNTGSNDGDVKGNHGNSDAWIFNIEGTGNLKWQKCFGGNDQEGATSVVQTADGFMFSGWATSKDGSITNMHTQYGYFKDAWVLAFDAQGNKKWDRAFGGGQHDVLSAIVSLPSNSYLIAGETSSTDGDVPSLKGGADALLVKIKDP